MAVVFTQSSQQMTHMLRNLKPLNFILLPFLFIACLKVQRHQFMGSQVLKIFAAKDDEVRTEKKLIHRWVNRLIPTCFLCTCSVWAACWCGAVRPHPRAGSAWYGGHCTLRLWSAKQPSSRSSFPVYQTALWSEITHSHARWCFTISVSYGTQLMHCLLATTVSHIYSAAFHGRPQTVYFSFFGKQQKDQSVR